jgi:hypothetical protein
MSEENLSFEKQLEMHAPYLNQRVVTYFEKVDLLSYVHAQQDPNSRVVERIIIEDKMVALDGAYKQVKNSRRLQDSIEVLESVEGQIDELTVSRLGKMLIGKSDEFDINSPEAQSALQWAIDVLGDKKNIKVYHRLFDKKLAEDSKPKPSLVDKPQASIVEPETVQAEETIKTASQKRGQTHHVRFDQPSDVRVNPRTHLAMTTERRHSAARNARGLSDFGNSLKSFIDGSISGGEVRLNEVSRQAAEVLEIGEDAARTAILNVVASSDDLRVGSAGGSKVIGPANKSVAELFREEPVDSTESSVEADYPLDIDDFEIIQDILEVVASKQYVTQGSTSREIELELREKGYKVDSTKVNALIRAVCAVSEKAVFEKRGNYGRSRKGPQLFFDSAAHRREFIDDPIGFTEGLFEKIL